MLCCDDGSINSFNNYFQRLDNFFNGLKFFIQSFCWLLWLCLCLGTPKHLEMWIRNCVEQTINTVDSKWSGGAYSKELTLFFIVCFQTNWNGWRRKKNRWHINPIRIWTQFSLRNPWRTNNKRMNERRKKMEWKKIYIYSESDLKPHGKWCAMQTNVLPYFMSCGDVRQCQIWVSFVEYVHSFNIFSFFVFAFAAVFHFVVDFSVSIFPFVSSISFKFGDYVLSLAFGSKRRLFRLFFFRSIECDFRDPCLPHEAYPRWKNIGTNRRNVFVYLLLV